MKFEVVDVYLSSSVAVHINLSGSVSVADVVKWLCHGILQRRAWVRVSGTSVLSRTPNVLFTELGCSMKSEFCLTILGSLHMIQ